MANSLLFFDWEARPAVKAGARAWAVLSPGEGWTEVDGAEVSDSGRLLNEATFANAFLGLPPLPEKVRQVCGGSPIIG